MPAPAFHANFRRLVVLFSILLSAVSVWGQNTIEVPADQPTIQSAVNAANPGDTVLVSAGTYTENVNFQGKNITVTSAAGAAQTIIDGGANGAVVTFNSGEGAGAVLSGFTIRNGKSALSGGGIEITNASPTIQGNTITGNHAVDGIGINVNGGSPVIQNNVIANNSQCCGTSGFGGGGIGVAGSNTTPAAPQIIGNTITNNSLPAGGFGGGIDVAYFSSPLIENNTISGNSAYNYGGGINITSYNPTLVVGNIITNNSAGGGGSGGGVSFFAGGGNSVLVNNTLYGNHAADGSSEILVSYSLKDTMINNVVLATTGTALTCDAGAQPAASHNDIYSLNGVAFGGNCSSMAGSNGNIAADPLFVNAAHGNFQLLWNSPAIDAGDNSAANLPSKDFGGNPRIVDGNGDGNAVVDMGVYEFQPMPQLQVSATSLAFGQQLVNTTSTSQPVTISNPGNAPLSITNISAGTPFAQTNNCGASLVPGNVCTVNVTYSPAATGPASGTLGVNVGAPATSQNIALTGTGIVATASVSPSVLSFSNQLVGAMSAAQPVTLTNTGSAVLQINAISVAGDFSQTNTCGSSLAPGAGCAINVSFTPTALGTRTGSLTVSSNTSGTAPVVSLSGTGVEPLANATPTALVFGAQLLNTASAAQPITLSNTGGATLHLSGISMSGDFTQANGCGSSLAAGASCGISVTFTPTAVGSRGGSLSVASDSAGGIVVVSLSGTGVVPFANATPAAVVFKPQLLKTTSAAQTVTLSNTGGATLHLSGISVSGDFEQANGCGSTLAAGASCSIMLTFTPTALGLRSGSLTIASDSAGGSLVVPLSGAGIIRGPRPLPIRWPQPRAATGD